MTEWRKARVDEYQDARTTDGSNKQSLLSWDRASGELVTDRRPFDIDGFDWEAYPSAEVPQ